MKIELAAYDESWPAQFDHERRLIVAALSNKFLCTIEHIGSTSVPGLAAKPIIDIMVGVQREERLDQCIQPMIESGYVYYEVYTAALPERRLFQQLTHPDKEKQIPEKVTQQGWSWRSEGYISQANIHTVVKDGAWWNRHIAFRDHLREHDSDRDLYASVKQDLSQKDWAHINDYANAKSAVISEISSRIR